MNEYYFNEAIVLDREPSNEIDNRFSIYIKGFGKIVARGKSTRKITSKLSGHLEPGNLVKVRLIEKNGLQVVDALKSSKIEIRSSAPYFLNKLLPEHDFDFALWQELVSHSMKHESGGDKITDYVSLNWKEILKILGWDPEHAVCEVCGSLSVSKFTAEGQIFSCDSCSARLTNFISIV